MLRQGIIVLILLCSGLPSDARAQDSAPVQDMLLITPTTQGTFDLPHTGLSVEIGYATVRAPARLTATCQDSGQRCTIAAVGDDGAPLDRFEMPLIIHLPRGQEEPLTARDAAGAVLPARMARRSDRVVSAVIGWPLTITLAPPDKFATVDAGRWLVVFDAHGLYAQPAWDALPDSIVYLGPLEHYHPTLLDHRLASDTLEYAASEPLKRAIWRTETHGSQSLRLELPTAARTPRYADRFVPEDRGNPGGFLLLGWADADDLPDVVRALRATIPADPDLPAPGGAQAPLSLSLPFDCARDWAVSWGYHHSTPQNRFAVDFAVLGTPGETVDQPVYATHAGTVFLKRYGTSEHLIDIGLAARVVAADGITSTVYGHLEEVATLRRWGLAPESLPDFAWIEVGNAAQGDAVGTAGRTGYATGPHIHFVLWSWDQSFYQPVPLGPLIEFVRGQQIPAALRSDCDLYAR